MPTLDDIAKELGLTKGTVSKALSGATDISEATRTKVLDTAVEMGYKRVVRKSKGKLVIFIENMDWETPDDFGYNLIGGFRKMAEPADYNVTIVPLTKQFQEETTYDAYMFRNDYKGAFFLGLTFSDPWTMELVHCKTPAVLYDAKITGNPYTAMVSVDNREGILQAVSLLQELGHTKIGYLSSDLGNYVYNERYNAFLQAMRLTTSNISNAANTSNASTGSTASTIANVASASIGSTASTAANVANASTGSTASTAANVANASTGSTASTAANGPAENPEEYARHAYLTTEILTKHLPDLLEKGCTAFACSHDLLAHSVMQHCLELGYRVPDDISIIGFDDIPLCQVSNPPLSTIRQDRTELGKSAFFALNSLFNHVSVSAFQLHPQMILRGTTGVCKKD